MASTRASYFMLLFVHENLSLNELGIWTPWAMIKKPPIPPPFSHLDPLKYITISQSYLGSIGIFISSNWKTCSFVNSIMIGLSSDKGASAR